MSERLDWQREADRLARAGAGVEEPTAWFDRLYRGAAEGSVTTPWDRQAPHFALAPWLDSWHAEHRVESGARAVVVGCGLGADAEHLASLGYQTTGFDVSPTALELARKRNPGSKVDYRRADLFDLPPKWQRAFDLVVEIYTVQALPLSHRRRATAAVAGLLAEGGTLVAIQAQREESDTDPDGPPWPLTRAEVEAFAGDGVELVALESVARPDDADVSLWRAELRRRPSGAAG